MDKEIPTAEELASTEMEIIQLIQSFDLDEKTRLRLCRLARRNFAVWQSATKAIASRHDGNWKIRKKDGQL